MLKYAAIGLVLGPFVVVSGILLFWLGRNPTELVTITDEDPTKETESDFWDDAGEDVDKG